jgi:large subunit ribosomal protein L6
MSRIGKLPVTLPSGVLCEVSSGVLSVKGQRGILTFPLLYGIEISINSENNVLLVLCNSDEKQAHSNHGLTRATISNMIEGVTKGHERRLEIRGVGYRAQTTGTKITLTVGYSHPVELIAPEGVEVLMHQDEKNIIVVRGIDKQAVGQFASEIREIRKPEPYKGKGIRYAGEYVRQKAGKSAGKK